MRGIPSLFDHYFLKGGPGSGNFGHAGRPGQQGGSAPDGEPEFVDMVDPTAPKETVNLTDSMDSLEARYKKLTSMTEQQYKELTPQSRDAVKNYTGNEYMSINEALRNPQRFEQLAPDIKAEIGEQIEQITNAVNRPLPEDLTVWRGVSAFGFIKPGGNERLLIEKFTKAIGQTITMDGFQSTSVNPRQAVQFTSNDFDVVFRIKTKKGLAVDGKSAVVGEEEVLLGHNWKYKVEDAKFSEFVEKAEWMSRPLTRKRFMVDLRVEE